jgi:hypothetical protein
MVFSAGEPTATLSAIRHFSLLAGGGAAGPVQPFLACAWMAPTDGSSSEGSGTVRALPMGNLRIVARAHLEEMRHSWAHRRLAFVIRGHGYDSAKHLEHPAVEIFHDLVMRPEPGVDERPEIGADRFAPMPVGDPEIADGVFADAIEALPYVLSSISFHIASSQSGALVRSNMTVFSPAPAGTEPKRYANQRPGGRAGGSLDQQIPAIDPFHHCRFVECRVGRVAVNQFSQFATTVPDCLRFNHETIDVRRPRRGPGTAFREAV